MPVAHRRRPAAPPGHRDPEDLVGIDVEGVDAVASGWDPALVLEPGERADTPLEQAGAWVRKEAVLTARGTGLMMPMSAVRLADEQWEDIPRRQASSLP